MPAQEAAGEIVLARGDLPATRTSSSISYRQGLTRANIGILELSWSGDGTIKVHNGSNGSVHFILEVPSTRIETRELFSSKTPATHNSGLDPPIVESDPPVNRAPHARSASSSSRSQRRTERARSTSGAAIRSSSQNGTFSRSRR